MELGDRRSFVYKSAHAAVYEKCTLNDAQYVRPQQDHDRLACSASNTVNPWLWTVSEMSQNNSCTAYNLSKRSVLPR